MKTVKCIDDSPTYYYSPALTRGKVYAVAADLEGVYAVIDDSGNEACYSKARFCNTDNNEIG